MAEALKLIYNKKFLQDLIDALVKVNLKFNASEFRELVFDNDWKQRELKDRMHHIAHSLQNFFHPDPQTSIPLTS